MILKLEKQSVHPILIIYQGLRAGQRTDQLAKIR